MTLLRTSTVLALSGSLCTVGDRDVGTETPAPIVRTVTTFVPGAHRIDTEGIQSGSAPIFRSSTEAVLVDVSVRDGRGRFVAGLQKDQFRLYDNGVPQEVTLFEREARAFRVVLVIDISASMKKNLRPVQRAASAFLTALRPDDSVTLVAFNRTFFVLAPPTASPEERLSAVRGLTASYGTALFDALLASLDLLGIRDRRRALVVFTDGEDRISKATLASVQQRLASDDVLLYVVGYGDASELPRVRGTLDTVARDTGGRAVFLNSVRKAPGAFRDLLQDLSERYTLGFIPVSAGQTGGWRELRVEVQGGEYLVRARHGYLSHRAR